MSEAYDSTLEAYEDASFPRETPSSRRSSYQGSGRLPRMVSFDEAFTAPAMAPFGKEERWQQEQAAYRLAHEEREKEKQIKRVNDEIAEKKRRTALELADYQTGRRSRIEGDMQGFLADYNDMERSGSPTSWEDMMELNKRYPNARFHPEAKIILDDNDHKRVEWEETQKTSRATQAKESEADRVFQEGFLTLPKNFQDYYSSVLEQTGNPAQARAVLARQSEIATEYSNILKSNPAVSRDVLDQAFPKGQFGERTINPDRLEAIQADLQELADVNDRISDTKEMRSMMDQTMKSDKFASMDDEVKEASKQIDQQLRELFNAKNELRNKLKPPKQTQPSEPTTEAIDDYFPSK